MGYLYYDVSLVVGPGISGLVNIIRAKYKLEISDRSTQFSSEEFKINLRCIFHFSAQNYKLSK